ncbi:MAG: prepilin-type N-terminal cleavage/methylation domain-containing protein [Flavobacteriales bacterium]|nr:prepilin-type N-terminal cleavage/methylation domain-containing protein [Flavobacteriales bacterium]
MKTNGKLRAFTLVEMMVSMLIVTVVLMMAAYGFRTVTEVSRRIRSELERSESNYLILSNVEQQFKRNRVLTKHFNDIQLDDVLFEFGVETTLRRQEGRIDTFPSVISEPKLIEEKSEAEGLISELVFQADSTVFVLKGSGDLALWMNERTRNGQD